MLKIRHVFLPHSELTGEGQFAIFYLQQRDCGGGCDIEAPCQRMRTTPVDLEVLLDRGVISGDVTAAHYARPCVMKDPSVSDLGIYATSLVCILAVTTNGELGIQSAARGGRPKTPRPRLERVIA